jgi:hypothetical protein
MERKLALGLGAATLALLIGVGGPMAEATPMAMPIGRVHVPRAPRLHEPRPAPDAATAKSQDKPPPQQFHGLMAQDQTAVRTRLGDPDVARGEGSGAMWTYRLPDCALFIFFKGPKGAPDAGSRVSGAASGPRVRGQRPLPVNDCIAEAMTRRASGAPAGAL